MLNIYTVSSFAVGVACGLLLRRQLRLIGSLLHKNPKRIQANKKLDDAPNATNTNESSTQSDEDNGAVFADSGEFKMVLVVRNDLKMGKGKAAAQCAHATVGCCKSALRQPDLLAKWESYGQPKIVLKCETDKELNDLKKAADKRGLINYLVRDAGRTQIASGSRTVLGIGPAPTSAIDDISGHLKLY